MTRKSSLFIYVISFLIPLIGYILGAVLLLKTDATDKKVGKNCIILGIVSAIISLVFVGVFIRIALY